MNKFQLLVILPLFTFSYSDSTAADINSKLLSCSKIKQNADRLTCYDQISLESANGSDRSEANLEMNDSNVSKQQLKAALVKDGQKSVAPSTQTPDIKLTESTPSKPDSLEQEIASFGKTNDDRVKSFTSRIIGKINGWEKGSSFKLENGQVWKVISSREVYTKLENPEITISRAFFGSFNAKIDGVTTLAKVRRIK